MASIKRTVIRVNVLEEHVGSMSGTRCRVVYDCAHVIDDVRVGKVPVVGDEEFCMDCARKMVTTKVSR